MTIEFISPPVSYGTAKSNFVKDLIRASSFSDDEQRAYIDELLTLERFILDGVSGYASGMHFLQLKDRYGLEWLRIYEELKPDELKEMRRKEEQEKEERKHEEAVRKEEERRWEECSRQEWISLGGKP